MGRLEAAGGMISSTADFTLAHWNLLLQEEFHIGAALIRPKELGRNTEYVFALPARYNYAFPTGYEEVEKILARAND